MTSRMSVVLLWISFVLLLILGMVMVASTSPPGEGHEALWKQGRFALIGIALALTMSLVDYRKLRPWVILIWGAVTLLLIGCFVPGIGREFYGESRWVRIGITFQPSEMAKIAIMLSMAIWYSKQRGKESSFVRGFVVPGFIFATPLLLILFEKDMGTAAALGLSGFCLMFAAGARAWVLLLALLAGSLFFYMFTTSSPNRMARIDAWHNPEAYRYDAGMQQYVATVAFASGGTTGVGLGNSHEKYANLPFADTDFIFAVIGEELGLIGSVGVVILFTLFATAGLFIALRARDRFGRLLALGLVMTIFWPALLNIMVVTSVLPNSGLPLPFISNGGTNLIFTILAVGIITSVQRFTRAEKENLWPLRRKSNTSRGDTPPPHS